MTINIENLETLINHLKGLKNPSATFDMGSWMEIDEDRLGALKLDTFGKVSKRLILEGDCNTAACIAGHARILACPEETLLGYYEDYSVDTSAIAQDWLGLSDIQSDRLFTPTGFSHAQVPVKLAIRVLEKLRDSAMAGEPMIDWFGTEGEMEKEKLAAPSNG